MWTRNMAEEETLFPPSRRVKSEVWKYFGYRKDAKGLLLDDNFPICKKCGRRVAAKGGNTSNMFTHLRHNHLQQLKGITIPLSIKIKSSRKTARVNTNPVTKARYLANTKESNDIDTNSQWQQESAPYSPSSETDCSSVTQESPGSSHGWMKQEPKNEIIVWENINSEAPTDAEQDITLSNAISTTTPMEGLPPSVMLTITKLQCLVESKQEKIEALEKQVQDLQEDRKFLRTQIENLTSARVVQVPEVPTASTSVFLEPRSHKRHHKSVSSPCDSDESFSDGSISTDSSELSSIKKKRQNQRKRKRGCVKCD